MLQSVNCSLTPRAAIDPLPAAWETTGIWVLQPFPTLLPALPGLQGLKIQIFGLIGVCLTPNRDFSGSNPDGFCPPGSADSVLHAELLEVINFLPVIG